MGSGGFEILLVLLAILAALGMAFYKVFGGEVAAVPPPPPAPPPRSPDGSPGSA